MKIREDHILKALGAKHEEKDAFFTHVKNGPTQTVDSGELAIIDAIAVSKSWTKPVIHGYEVKVSRSDFLRDTKHHKYYDMCNEFSFVCPTKMIDKAEVPEDAGLLYYNHEKGTFRTVKKAPYREIPMPTDMLWHIVISRAKSDSHPFFSSRRQLLEHWVMDKKDRVQLGNEVSAKIWRILNDVPNLRRDVEMYEETFQAINELLEPYGETIYPGLRAYGLAGLRQILNRRGGVDLQALTAEIDKVHKTLHELRDHQEQSTKN